jgi:hypothetical protein
MAREMNKPTIGTYAMRLVKGGPMVPVRITCTDGRWSAVVNGSSLTSYYSQDDVDEMSMWWVLGERIDDEDQRLFVRILTAKAITEAQYDAMLRLLETAPPEHPCHRPDEAIDWKKMREIRMANENRTNQG